MHLLLDCWSKIFELMEGGKQHHSEKLEAAAASAANETEYLPEVLSEKEFDEVIQLEKKCKQGKGEDAESCSKLMGMYRRVCHVETPSKNSSWACFELAKLLQAGVESKTPASNKEALEHYELACGQKYWRACYSAAEMYQGNDKVIEKDLKKALSLYDTACFGSHAKSCNSAAVLLQKSGQHRDAANRMGRACHLGNLHSCSNLGLCFRYGLGVKKDAKVAASFLRYACERGRINTACDSWKSLQKEINAANGSSSNDKKSEGAH